MAKAGGIIAIVAGVLGIFAALVTLSLGGVGDALGAERADTATGMGIAGLLLSFLVIIFGAVAISNPMGGGWCLFFTSIAGIIYGGTIVGIFMILALIGGILALAGAGSVQAELPATAGGKETAPPQKPGGILSALRVLVMVVLSGIIVITMIAILGTMEDSSVSEHRVSGRDKTTSSAGVAQDSARRKSAPGKITIFPMGEKIPGEYFEVTVNNFEMQENIVTLYEAEAAGEGMLFAALHLTVTCIDKESRFYHPGGLMIHLEDGSQIMYDNAELFFGLESVNQQLNPYTTAKGFIVYKIPERFKNEKITWMPGRSFSNTHVLLQERSNASK